MSTRETISPDTIAAISTPPGRGGIGIVRLAGPDAFRIATTLVRTDAPLKHAHLRFGRVLDPEAEDPGAVAGVDEAIVTAFQAPHSYTGDDLVEIACHGSPVILEAVLQAALASGARLARPGEFTERAFLSGRLDLTQAEAVHDLIAAQTLDQARTAARQLGGALSRRIAPMKELLLHLIALLEAGMDFASGELDDVEALPADHIAEQILRIQEPLDLLERSFRSGFLRRHGASLALIGLPNVGKSSLFNRLLDRDRAIVTPVPGTTRDTLEELLSIRGLPIRLVDTAGLRPSTSHDASGAEALEEAVTHAELLGMVRSREALADADLVLLVHDASRPLVPEENQLKEELAARPCILVTNKIDLPGAVYPWHSPATGSPTSSGALEIAVSALSGAGLDRLRDTIMDQLGAAGDAAEAGGLNNLRQGEAVRDALAALTYAAAANQARLPHEILLVDLHTALAALDSLTGQTTSDDILERIFSTFCIGK